MNAFIKRHIISLAFLILASTLVFSNTFKNSFIWDDKAIVAKGEYISKPENIPLLFTTQYWRQFYLMLSRTHSQKEKVHYRPILMASFAIDYSLWKLNPFGYHLSNILFHTISVLLVYFLIFNIVRPREKVLNLPFISALLFAVHPIHAESVTWIKNRSDLLAFIFFLSSLIFFMKFRFNDKTRARIVFYCASFLCFTLALFSKSMAITLPLILALYIISFVPKGQWKGLLVKILPFFGAMLIYTIFELGVLGRVGSAGDITGKMSPYHNILIVIKTVGYYLRLLVFPINLNAERPFGIPVSFFEPAVFFSALLLAILIFATFYIFKRSRVVAFFLLWIFLTLIPISNIIFLASRPIAEQRLYIPSMGLCVLIALAVGIKRRWTLALLIPMAIFYSYILMGRNLDWKDSVTFWTKTVSASPDSHRAYNNLGTAYYDKGLYQEALDSYIKSTEIYSGYALAYNNMGVTYRDMGRSTDAAIESFKKAIEFKPDYAEAHNNLGGLIYESLGQVDAAMGLYKKAVEIEPDYAEAYFNLGLMHDLSGDYEKAMTAYQKTIELNPELGIEAYNNLAYLYIKEGRIDEAIDLAEKALSIEPQNAEVLDTIGWAYYQKGDLNRAVDYLEEAVTFLPDNLEIREHLDNVYRDKGGRGIEGRYVE